MGFSVYYIQLRNPLTGHKSVNLYYIQLYIVPRENHWLVTNHIVHLYYIQLYIVHWETHWPVTSHCPSLLYTIVYRTQRKPLTSHKSLSVTCDRSMGFSVHYMQLYVIKIYSDLWPVNGFLCVLYTAIYNKDWQWLVTGQLVSQCTIYFYKLYIVHWETHWPVTSQSIFIIYSCI
jgi:hypothetical protein